MAATIDYCKYHPNELAGWYCAGCHTHFCNRCTPLKADEHYPNCILCRRSLESLSISHKITPFWKKLADLLKLPFSTSSLILIVCYAFVFSIMPQGKIGAVLTMFCLLPLVEFLFECMQKTACGEPLNFKVTEYFSLKNKVFFVKLLVTFVLAVVFLSKLYQVNQGLTFLLAAFFIFGIPASMMILMMEKSMVSMINPIKIGFIIKTFTSAYLLLYAFIILLVLIYLSGNQMEGSQQIKFLPSFLLNFTELYLATSIFVMAGYLVFQYHHELNFSISSTAIQSLDVEPADDMAEINIFIQEARYEDAQRLLLNRIEANALDYKACEKLILLYAIQHKMSYFNKIAQNYFINLVTSGKQKHAADFYLKLHSRQIDFLPESIDVVIAISAEMQNKKQFKIALDLLEKTVKNEPMPEKWDKLYLLHSKILAEYANRIQDAIKLLDIIIIRSFDEEILRQAEDYLAQVKSF